MSLFNRVRGAFSGARDFQVNADPHAWRLPSSYSTSKPGGKQTVIPNPKIFTNAFIPSEAKVGNLEIILVYPDVGHAAVHLALLECFRSLRLSAIALDVKIQQPPAYVEKLKPITSLRPTTPVESERWDLLVRLAITRFSAWWSNIDYVLNHAAAYGHHASDKVAVQLAKNYLPPLDVLLVWYAFMLDSNAYEAACRDHERNVPRLQQLCFPWPAIRDLINLETMQFVLPSAAQTLFSTLSGQFSDIMTYLEGPPAYTEAVALPFEADLFAEVKKHEMFIDKAHGLLWIRGPSLSGSLTRASLDYLDYQLRGISVDEKGRDAPFGIELLWRTHRLFPKQYEIFLQEVGDGGKSNNSKKVPPLRSLSLGAGAVDLDIASGQCQCWTCERIRDDLPTFIHPPPPFTTTSLSQSSSSSAIPSIPTQHQLSSLSPEQVRQIQDDLGFYQAVESARRRGEPLPTRPPTAVEKEVERLAKDKKKEVGYRPVLSESFEILPDGTRRIRTQKFVNQWGRNAGWV